MFSRQNWQFASAMCLFLAAKLRDTYIFSANELVEFTDHTYSAQQLIEGERTILTTLNFEIGGIVMAHDFLPHLSSADHDVRKARQLLGMSVLDYGMALKKPSLLAAGSIAAVSPCSCNKGALTDLLNLREEEITACQQQMLAML